MILSGPTEQERTENGHRAHRRGRRQSLHAEAVTATQREGSDKVPARVDAHGATRPHTIRTRAPT